MSVNNCESSETSLLSEKENISETCMKDKAQEHEKNASDSNKLLRGVCSETFTENSSNELSSVAELDCKTVHSDCLITNKMDDSIHNIGRCSDTKLHEDFDLISDTNTNLDNEIVLKEKVNSLLDKRKNDISLSIDNNDERLIESVQFFYPDIEISKASSDVIHEGFACILKQSKNVFYNPVQEFNRDLSVAAISVFSEEHQNDPRCYSKGTKRKKAEKDSAENSDNESVPGVKYDNGIVILEALSATGLRSIRYAKEVPFVKEIVANDISSAAVDSIKKNIQFNKVENLVSTSQRDASLLMYQRKSLGKVFDVIDLDPYGCPSRFLDAAVQCVRDGGLLLITCTDMAVLAGNSPETCYVKYGAISLRNPACHEMALRITLQCIESHANRYGRYIVPQLSFSADFYIRVIVKVYTSPAMCKRTTSKLSMIYQCGGCQMFNYWPLGITEKNNNSLKFYRARGPPVAQHCPHCGSTYYQGGPIWSAPLHDLSFVEKMLLNIDDREFGTEKRMEGMLELIREELETTLLYYTIDSLCSKVHCEVVPRNKFVSAILHAGHQVSLSHAAPNSIKTNAPASVIWDIVRCWVQDHPVNPKRLPKGSVAEKILDQKPQLQANFELHPEAIPRNRKRLLRYQQNPQPFWGPGTRDKTNCHTENKMSKSYTNQNKKHKRVKLERQKTSMATRTNSNDVEIIEVVTITDDEDDIKIKCSVNNLSYNHIDDDIAKEQIDKGKPDTINDSFDVDVDINLKDVEEDEISVVCDSVCKKEDEKKDHDTTVTSSTVAVDSTTPLI